MFDKMRIAYDKSNEVVDALPYERDKKISTQAVIDFVKRTICEKIDILYGPFKEMGIKQPYGAMMRVDLNEKNRPREVTIVLNSELEPAFQRFSLLHEFGHLLTTDWDEEADARKDSDETGTFIVSTHIDYNITNISEDQYENNEYLTNEQIANIFALRVLMPGEQFYEKMEELKEITKVARFFGLTEDAVMSRMRIGA